MIAIDRLYPYQKRFIGDTNQFRVVNKARQIGFSFTIALEGFHTALKIPKSIILYVSVGERQAKELLSKIKLFSKIPNIPLSRDSATELSLPNQSRLISLPNNPDTIVGYTADRIYLDEFSHYQREKAVLTAIAPSLTRTDKKRYLTIISTPLGKGGEFYRICTDDNNYSKHQVDIYQAIKDGCPANVGACRNLVLDDISFRQEFMCEFIDEVTSFFPYDLLKATWNTELPNADETTLKRCSNPLYAGYDPAKRVDSGVFVVVERTPKKNILRHIKEWQGVDYSEQLAYIEHFMRAARITKLISDETGVGGKIQEDLSKSLGSVAEGLTYTNARKEELMTNLRVLLQDKDLEIPYNDRLIAQLHGINRIVGITGIVKYRHEEGKHDDMVHALAMACYGFSGKVKGGGWTGQPIHLGSKLESAKSW